MFNLLTEPLIGIDPPGEPRRAASLPEVYAALIADRVDAFPALRSHQRHAVHAFLSQLGAMALHRAGLEQPPVDAAEWRELLRALTPDWPDDEPWHLVVDDITKPAFMQPPAAAWTGFNQAQKEWFLTPDALDMLDTAKNHDLKTQVGSDAEAEDWAFSLISMQTMNGHVGVGNYPIARMNSGDGSRTAFSVTPSSRPGIHIQRDIKVLLERSEEIIGELPFNWNGIGLLWLNQWNGEKSEILELSDLHPFYIEICRRRRLRLGPDGSLYAVKAGSKGRRVAAAEQRGVVGDPWTLVTSDNKGFKALTLQTGSFNYKEITKYLTSADWTRPVMSQPTQDEVNQATVQLVMRGIRRKKGGQTEGYYERIIPIRSGKLRSAMLRRRSGIDSDELGAIAQSRIENVRIVQSILRQAIQTFMARGDSGKVIPAPAITGPWLNRLDEIVDARFFDDLQIEVDAAESDRDGIRKEWLKNGNDGVIDHAGNILNIAIDSLHCPSIKYHKARANAESVFWSRLQSSNGLPFVFAEPDKEEIKECPSSNQSQMDPNPAGTQMTLFG